MDHDRLFKELLTTFFFEFVKLFLPDVAPHLDRNHLEFLDKEVFTDVAAGRRHEVDLLAKVRFLGYGAAFFLIHVENQATAEPDFAERMFKYFARLYEKYGLRVFPVVLLSYDQPLRAENNRHVIEFPWQRIVDFTFRVIQLNRLNWRDYVRNPNPVASALMTKMHIAEGDRPRVKLECLRMLATLKLDKARSTLVSAFMENYLKLTTEELAVYNQELEAIVPQEREVMMQLTNEWIEQGKAEGRSEGRSEGRNEGRREVVLRLLGRRFKDVPADLQGQLTRLTDSQMDELIEAVFDFSSIADAKAWLARHAELSKT